MNWEDERYVRVYTRDTTSWLLWSWQAQALFCLLLRKADRTGAIDLGAHGKRGVCAHVKMPWELAEGALDELLTDGCLQVRNETSTDRNAKTILVFVNFVAAQEAVASSKLRQQRWREKAPKPNETSTDGDVSLRNVDAARRGETRGDSVPSRAVPSRAVLPEEAYVRREAPDAPTARKRVRKTPAGPAAEHADAFLEWFNRKLERKFELREPIIRLVARLLQDGFGQGDMRAVAKHARELWGNDAKMAEFLRPSSLLTREKFGERLDMAKHKHPEWAERISQWNAGGANGSSLPTVPEAGADVRGRDRDDGSDEQRLAGSRAAAADGVRGRRMP